MKQQSLLSELGGPERIAGTLDRIGRTPPFPVGYLAGNLNL